MTNQTVVKKLIKLIAYGLILLLLLIVSLLLFIRSPWGQSIIVKEATEYVSNKTNTTVEIQRLFITFDGNLFLEKLYLDDVKGDTLIYVKSIEASVELIPLITSQQINVDFIEWDGLKANVERKVDSESFNFNFLIEAFSTADSSEVSEAAPPPSEIESSEPLKLSIGTIHLSNFSIQYEDHFLGINSKLDLEDLLFNANEIDLEKLIFDVEELRLKGTEISYLQTKPFEETEESTDSILPQFIVKHLSLDSVQVDYRSTVDQLSSNINIFHFGLNSSDLNLNKQIIHLEEIFLDSSSFELVTMPTESAANDTSQSNTGIQWPDWNVEINKASFSNNNIDLRTSLKQDVYNEFNDEHFKLAELNLSLEQVSLKKEEFAANLQGLSFKERSNFQLNNLAFQLGVSPKDISLSDFRLSTPNNQIVGRALVEYTNLEELLKQNVSNFSIYFPHFSLNAKDAFFFVPSLRKDTLLKALNRHNLAGTVKATGTSTDLQLEQLVANWGASTNLSLAANLKNYNDQDKLEFLLNDFRFSSKRRDLLAFVEEEELGIQIPKTIQLSADASGSMNNIVGNAIAKIPEGELSVDGSYSNQKELSFKGVVKAKKLKVGKLLQNPNLGIVSLSLEAEGQGSSIDSLQAKFKTDIQKLELFNYDYADLQLSGNLKNKQGEVEARFKDYNLNAELSSSFTLDSLNSKMKLNLNLIGADLNALGWSERKLKTGFDLEASFEGNENEFEVHTQLANDVTVFEQEPYSLGTITIDARNTPDFSMLKLTNDYFNVDFNSNSSYSQVLKALENQLTYYFNENDSLNSPDSVKMDLRLTAREAPVLTEAIAPELEFDSIQLEINYNQANHFLNANLSSDHLKYKESKIDSILFLAGSNEQNFTFNLRFAELSASPVKIPRTELKGEFKDQIALVDFKISNELDRLMHIKSEIKLTDDSVSYHVNPDSLLLNRKDWEISKENNILLINKTIQANNFSLTRNGQNLKIDSRKEEKKDVFELLFNDFKLSTFTNFLNTDDSLATGIVNGNLVLENPLEEMGIISSLTVDKLKVMKIPLGKLQFNSVSQKNEEYDLDLSLQGQAIDLTLDGGYTAKKTEGLLDFSLNLQRLELNEFERLTSDYLSDLKGSISAKIKLNGTTHAPNYNGSVDFKSTGFVVNTLNSRFKLPDEGVTFDTSKVVLDDFLIQDSQNNAFHLDGDIFTNDLSNPSFDLTLKANRFQVLNSTAEDNEEFYGKVNLNTDLTINGDLTIPIIRGQLAINDNSSFTYVVPEDELDLVERDGVIVFVNKKNPDAILTREEENETSSEVLKGYDLSASLKVGEEVDFKIIIDQRSGDNLKIQGNGDFQLGLEPNGRTTFAGKYEVSDGYYEASLYNIVNRRFEIANGSSIVWRGNPLDADMDIRAIYKVETQASSLMAAKTSGQGIAIENDFRKKLPFLVYLNFDGELLQPEISFQLDMPEASQGEMGGQVYARVKQLNTQESELHKQVFSLLVLNQFFPTTSNDGTSGGSADLARGNVNKVLEDQLNNFSNKYLGKTGFELDFGVGSYTENQEAGGQTKTQLDLNAQKKLFNDQLIVSVGSGVSIEENSGNNQATTPVVGNISLEYIFSEEGTWRVKGFRKNEFESVIEGQLIVTGVSLIYQKEFNKFRELVEQIQKQNETQKKNDQ